MKITGIMPCYNLISGQFPFLECIVLGLPLVDELILIDFKSDDGTSELLHLLSTLEPRIKIIPSEMVVSAHYDRFDRALEEAIRQATGDWIIEIQADEYYHPRDHKIILELIEYCDKNGYNGIRQVSGNVHNWTEYDFYVYRNLRMFRKLDNIHSFAGGDCFTIGKFEKPREGFTTHNMMPEYDSDIKHYNLANAFPLAVLIRMYRHSKILSTVSRDRLEIYERELARFNISDISEIDKIPKELLDAEIFKGEIPDYIPEIFHELVGKYEYTVRNEVLEIISKGIQTRRIIL